MARWQHRSPVTIARVVCASVHVAPLPAGNKALEGRITRRGSLSRNRSKRREPHGWNRVQHPEEVEEEQTVEVVRNHEGGTRSGVASPARRRQRGNAKSRSS